MTSPSVEPKRFRFSLRNLFVAITGLSILLGLVTGIFRWQAVRWEERRAKSDLYAYGGVYSMASALYFNRTSEQSSWFFVTFLNRVEAVDLSPHNWSAMERRGKTLVVNDEALLKLHSFRKLCSLDLRDTQITNAGVRHLAAMRRLEQLDIRGTRVTDEGLNELRIALPNCEIIH